MRFRAPAYSSTVFWVTAAYLTLGLATFTVWLFTRDDSWIRGFFDVPGAMLAVWLSATSLVLSYRARGCFEAGEPMHSAWSLFGLSAICDLTGVLASQVFASESLLNPLRRGSFWSDDIARRLRETGLILGGTCRYALLAWALWYALQAYRRSGLLARYRIADHLLLCAMAAYLICEMFEVITAVRAGLRQTVFQIAGWPVDPLLWFLLAQALLLRRSAREMDGGRIGRCWKALSAGIMLVAVGDVTLLAARLGYLPWPYSALDWYIWLPAGAAFALAPAYQVEAVTHASTLPAFLE